MTSLHEPESSATAPGMSAPRPATLHWPLVNVTDRMRLFTVSLVRSPALLLAWIVVLTVLAWALLPGMFSPFDPLRTDTAAVLEPPSLTHLFGTDEVGRDVFSRVVYGTRLSLLTCLIAVGIGLVFGSLIGGISGFIGGRVDGLLMRLIDVLLSIPMLLLAMVLVTTLGFGPIQLAIAIGVALIGSTARVMRAETLRVRQSMYVDAERSIGARTGYVVIRHVFPNAIGPVLALCIIEIGQAILAIAALSFLGFGAPPPTPEWGSLVSGGQRYMASAWWMITFPGLVITVTVVAVNHIARSLGHGKEHTR